MKFLEADLETILYESDTDRLWDRGLKIDFSGVKKRQLRIGGYGIADLVFFLKENLPHGRGSTMRITVCELKKEVINHNTFFQALNYCKGISNYLSGRGFDRFYFDIALVGKSIDCSGSFVYLTDLISGDKGPGSINSISYFTYNYAIDGIWFKRESEYKLVNENFNK